MQTSGACKSFTSRIRKLGDPILHTRSPEIRDFSDLELASSREELHAALCGFQRENGFGRAIAAPQYGFPQRFIAFNVSLFEPETAAALRPLITALGHDAVKHEALSRVAFTMHNPVVHPSHACEHDTVVLWDDCFSFPDVLVRVKRYRHVDVSFALDDGTTVVHLVHLPLSLSELVQHEVDHLDGITSFERAAPLPSENVRSFVYRSVFAGNPKYFNSMVDVAYPL